MLPQAYIVQCGTLHAFHIAVVFFVAGMYGALAAADGVYGEAAHFWQRYFAVHTQQGGE